MIMKRQCKAGPPGLITIFIYLLSGLAIRYEQCDQLGRQGRLIHYGYVESSSCRLSIEKCRFGVRDFVRYD